MLTVRLCYARFNECDLREYAYARAYWCSWHRRSELATARLLEKNVSALPLVRRASRGVCGGRQVPSTAQVLAKTRAI
jgi:hypothetical protein